MSAPVVNMKMSSLATVCRANLLQRRLAELVDQHGSIRAAARVLKVDHAYFHCLMFGTKNNPSDTLLRKLGLRRVVTVTVTYTDRKAPE